MLLFILLGGKPRAGTKHALILIDFVKVHIKLIYIYFFNIYLQII